MASWTSAPTIANNPIRSLCEADGHIRVGNHEKEVTLHVQLDFGEYELLDEDRNEAYQISLSRSKLELDLTGDTKVDLTSRIGNEPKGEVVREEVSSGETKGFEFTGGFSASVDRLPEAEIGGKYARNVETHWSQSSEGIPRYIVACPDNVWSVEDKISDRGLFGNYLDIEGPLCTLILDDPTVSTLTAIRVTYVKRDLLIHGLPERSNNFEKVFKILADRVVDSSLPRHTLSEVMVRLQRE